MTAIQKIHSRSRNAEVNETAEGLIINFEKHDFSADAYLSELFPKLKQENQALTTAIKASGVSSRQSFCDEERDRAGKALFLCVNAACELPDENISQAAQSVNKILDKYTPAIFRTGYDEETTLVRSLLEELNSLNAEVTAVPQLALHVDHLKQRQADFDVAKDEYVKAQVNEKTSRSASKLKTEIVNLLNKNIIPYLNTMNKVNSAVYGNFALVCAELIERNNQRVKRR